MTQFRQTHRNILQPVKLLLLLLEILQLILAPSIMDQIIIVLVPLVVVDHPYPPEYTCGVGAGVVIGVGYASSAEEGTFGVPHLHEIPNHLAVAGQGVFVQRCERKAVFEVDMIVGKMFQVNYFLHALLFFDNVKFQLFLLSLKLLMTHVLNLPGRCKIRGHEMLDRSFNFDFSLFHRYLLKHSDTFIFSKLFFFNCFFQVINDILDQDISLLLDMFNAVFKSFDFVVVLDVNILTHQQYFTSFVDHIPQIIFLCLSYILETEKITLVQFENAPWVSFSYLSGLFQRRQPRLFYHIHHQCYLPFSYHKVYMSGIFFFFFFASASSSYQSDSYTTRGLPSISLTFFSNQVKFLGSSFCFCFLSFSSCLLSIIYSFFTYCLASKQSILSNLFRRISINFFSQSLFKCAIACLYTSYSNSNTQQSPMQIAVCSWISCWLTIQ